ncbi:hypothetical protein BBBOND_0211370 [Babesia bigemina]|uniref:Uncharacterized protein n=1 Tax=Babesia bigemina TaxID=5866 RepID=A0A061DD64_BABBI|nr:hypothetical protein BBBOND_0211370 [Babesia bigemina]CDR95990.1 hypothetical protein BBBOND_0211370 [Babesia bigemina]|eukprot:XP_012768176.1 hypothetical protein BBBOND_0211370 [Babesia bigemina]
MGSDTLADHPAKKFSAYVLNMTLFLSKPLPKMELGSVVLYVWKKQKTTEHVDGVNPESTKVKL